jgi:hypothetical protein
MVNMPNEPERMPRKPLFPLLPAVSHLVERRALSPSSSRPH